MLRVRIRARAEASLLGECLKLGCWQCRVSVRPRVRVRGGPGLE